MKTAIAWTVAESVAQKDSRETCAGLPPIWLWPFQSLDPRQGKYNQGNGELGHRALNGHLLN